PVRVEPTPGGLSATASVKSIESCSSVPTAWKCPTHVPTDGQADRLSVQATALPLVVPTNGLASVVRDAPRPQVNAGGDVPVTAPVDDSTVRSITNLSGLFQVERPAGIVWTVSVVGPGVGAIGAGVTPGVDDGLPGCVGVGLIVGDCAVLNPAVASTTTAATTRSVRFMHASIDRLRWPPLVWRHT